MSEENRRSKRWFGILSIPGWLLAAIKVLHFLEDVDWVREKLPFLASFGGQLIPKQLDTDVLILGLTWIIAFVVIAPLLARRIGSGRAVLVVMVPIFLAALVLGGLRGRDEINRVNQDFKARQHSAPSSGR